MKFSIGFCDPMYLPESIIEDLLSRRRHAVLKSIDLDLRVELECSIGGNGGLCAVAKDIV